jgi:hypothetical protein
MQRQNANCALFCCASWCPSFQRIANEECSCACHGLNVEISSPSLATNIAGKWIQNNTRKSNKGCYPTTWLWGSVCFGYLSCTSWVVCLMNTPEEVIGEMRYCDPVRSAVYMYTWSRSWSVDTKLPDGSRMVHDYKG